MCLMLNTLVLSIIKIQVSSTTIFIQETAQVCEMPPSLPAPTSLWLLHSEWPESFFLKCNLDPVIHLFNSTQTSYDP